MNNAKYRTLLETLKKDILSGKYSSEEHFPSIRALSRRFGLAGTTVQRAIEELGHQGLISRIQGRGTIVTKQGASRKLGVIVPLHAYSEIFTKIVGVLSRLAQEAGYTLVLGDVSSTSHSARERMAKSMARRFVEEGVAGVIFMPIDFLSDAERVNREVLKIFDDAGIAVVLCDYDIVSPPKRSGYDVVGINNVEAGAAMVEHLVLAGARRISFLLHPNSPLSHRNRYRGAVIAEKDRPGLIVRKLVTDPDDTKGILRHLKSFRPNAVICGNDALAVKFSRVLQKLKKAVPDDLLLAGFDGVQLGAMMIPPLTTICQPCDKMAEIVFHALVARIGNPSLPPREVYLPFRLIATESTVRPSGKNSQKTCSRSKGKE